MKISNTIFHSKFYYFIIVLLFCNFINFTTLWISYFVICNFLNYIALNFENNVGRIILEYLRDLYNWVNT